MQTRSQLLHTWTQQLQDLVPQVRVTQVRILALFSLGLLWAEDIALIRIAARLPLDVADLSIERRLRRWLASRECTVERLWDPIARALLARHGQRELRLVYDPTYQTQVAAVLVLGLVVRGRVMPLAWQLQPGQTPWPERHIDSLRRLCQRVAGMLPDDVEVTFLADSGITSAPVIDLCQELGWHVTLRLSADAQQGVVYRRPDGSTAPVWALVPGRGQRWCGTVTIFQAAGWRTLQLTIIWPPCYDEPWLLLSDRPAGQARVDEYRRRVQIEATFQDCKSRGWDIERSKVTDLGRLERLLVAVVLALWWSQLLGWRVIRSGLRCRFDRRDRRDLAVARLGRRWMQALLDQDRLPPLPFRYAAAQWTCRWLF